MKTTLNELRAFTAVVDTGSITAKSAENQIEVRRKQPAGRLRVNAAAVFCRNTALASRIACFPDYVSEHFAGAAV
jgi:DNA-binding transcriptional LysR family regulator